MKKQLYQIAVLYHNKVEDEYVTEIAVEPKSVLASSFDEAKMAATLAVPEKYKGELSKLEILVKSF